MLPERYLETFTTLPSKSVGMRIASQSAGGFIPDNDWISRFFKRASGHCITPDPEQQSAWLQGADIRPEIGSLPGGSIVMILDDHQVFLGCGKVSGDRIRNFNK